MLEQELNRKLAEWAGFEEQKNRWHSELGKKVLDWLFPDKHTVEKLPDFTRSLAPCFEWLIPNFGNNVEVKFKHGYPNIDTLTCEVWRHPKEYDGKNVMGKSCVLVTIANSPDYYALSLCLAIEKLIDSKVGVIGNIYEGLTITEK